MIGQTHRALEIHDLLKRYLGEETDLPPALLERLAELAETVHFKKGDVLVSEGAYHPYIYCIIRGGARSFQGPRGQEVVNWFAFENEWVGSMYNFQGKESKESIDFLEDSECLRFEAEKIKELQQNEKAAADFHIKLLEEYALYLEKRVEILAHREGIDRYLYILEEKPEYLQRISVTHLASYLGMSRETLSRLRKKVTV